MRLTEQLRQTEKLRQSQSRRMCIRWIESRGGEVDGICCEDVVLQELESKCI
jgi:hypothetical protein